MAQNQTLGSGELWFDRYLANDSTRGERYLGNTTSFGLSIDQTELEHEDADHGFKVMDDSVTVKMGVNASFVTDNVARENLALFFFGALSTLTLAPVSAGTQTVKVFKGLTYQVGQSLANPTGYRTLSSIVVKKGVTSLAENTDYTVDLTTGRVTMLAGSSAYQSGDNITFEYVTPSQSRHQIISGRQPVEGALRFLSFNAVGSQTDYYMPYVKLYPNGEFNLKGDDWQTIPFNVKVLKKEGYEFVYADGRPFA